MSGSNATLTNPNPISQDLVDAILLEVQTRYRLLAMDNLRPQLTNDEITVALYDAVDTLNGYAPATDFTIDQLFATNSDPRFRGSYYLCVSQKLLITLIWDWTSNGFSQRFHNFNVENRIEDYRKLLEVITAQMDTQIPKLKESTQKFLKRVVPYSQNLLRTVGFPYRRPLGGGMYGGGTGGTWD